MLEDKKKKRCLSWKEDRGRKVVQTQASFLSPDALGQSFCLPQLVIPAAQHVRKVSVEKTVSERDAIIFYSIKFEETRRLKS